MTNQDQSLVAAFLSSRSPTRVPRGRRSYGKRFMRAVDGPDYKMDAVQADIDAGVLNERGKKIRRRSAR